MFMSRVNSFLVVANLILSINFLFAAYPSGDENLTIACISSVCGWVCCASERFLK